MKRWVVGIIIRNGYVLIGELKKRDMKIPRMTWFFPYKEINEEESPRLEIKELMREIGIVSKISKYLFTIVPSENSNLEQIFYELEYVRGITKPNERFLKLIWVKPTQVFKYFTSMIDIRVSDYLKILEKSTQYTV